MTTVARPGPTTTGGGPALPTVEQLLILVARAERKGGLDYTEGARLRSGILHLANSDGQLRRKYDNERKKAWRWKQLASGPVDEQSRDALRRVVELATRWTHIPAKRQAGVSVLAAIRNDDPA